MVRDAPIEGYPVLDTTWTVQAFKDGPELNITGSAEEVLAELTRINPDYFIDFADQLATNKGLSGVGNKDHTMDKRFGPVCGFSNGWETCSYVRVNEGVDYLRGVTAQPPSMNGKGCSRVSCSWSAAIWWCHDTDSYLELPSWNTIADCATVIKENCQYTNPLSESNPGIVGQNFVSSISYYISCAI